MNPEEVTHIVDPFGDLFEANLKAKDVTNLAPSEKSDLESDKSSIIDGSEDNRIINFTTQQEVLNSQQGSNPPPSQGQAVAPKRPLSPYIFFSQEVSRQPAFFDLS